MGDYVEKKLKELETRNRELLELCEQSLAARGAGKHFPDQGLIATNIYSWAGIRDFPDDASTSVVLRDNQSFEGIFQAGFGPDNCVRSIYNKRTGTVIWIKDDS